jgi:hypothetical protein
MISKLQPSSWNQNRATRLPIRDSQKNLVGMLSLGDISQIAKSDLAGEVLPAVTGHQSLRDEHEHWLKEVLQDDRSQIAARRT